MHPEIAPANVVVVAPTAMTAVSTPIGDLPYVVKFELGSSKLCANAMPLADKMLAVQRAWAVMRELIKQGADPARLQVVGLNGWLPAEFPDIRVSHHNIRVDFVALPDLD